jgi:hypothetical protein
MTGANEKETKMDFSEALKLIKARKSVARAGWNGKGMWVRLFQAGYLSEDAMAKAIGIDYSVLPTALPYLVMKTADNSFVPWLASQTDILANDWVEV